jgi:hypothetical protein
MEDLSQIFAAVQSLASTKQLKDVTLMTGGDNDPNPIKLSAQKKLPITLPDVTFNIDASAELDIMLFNEATDTDPDNVIGAKDAIIVPNTSTDAYLKYAANVTLSATADINIPISSIGFNEKLSVKGNAAAAYYKRHNNGDALNQSFLSDIAAIHTIFKTNDIATLPEGDAVTFLVNGSLNSDLKISWSNLFSQSVSALTEFLPGGVTLDLNLAPSVTAEFLVKVDDAFALVIKKIAGGKCLLSVKKTKSVDTQFTLDAGISVSFKDSAAATAALTDIYNKIIQSVFGTSIDYVNKALKAVKDEIADVTQKALVNKLIALFKLEGVPDAVNKVIDKVNAIQQTVPNAIKKIATATAKLNFSYEYQRIDQKTELLSANMATADLLKYHDDLLRFNTTQLLSDMRAGSVPYQLNKYLNQHSLTITHTWGFGFTVFNFSLLSQTVNEVKNVINENFEGLVQVSTEGTAQYKWTLGKGSGSWMCQITGQMPAFGQSTLDQFQFTFLLNATLKDNNLNKDDLESYLDFGVVWNAIQPGDLANLSAKYSGPSTIIHQPALVENKLTFSPEITKALIQKNRR